MIIKVATSKNADGSVNWTSLYAGAIRNRLRKDLNLADIPNAAEARKNLGIKNSMLDISEDLQTILKEYIDKQDISFYNQMKNYINSTVIPSLTGGYGVLGNRKREVINISTIEYNNFTISQVPSATPVIVLINGIWYFEEENDFTVNRTSDPVLVMWNTEVTGFSIDNKLTGRIVAFYEPSQ